MMAIAQITTAGSTGDSVGVGQDVGTFRVDVLIVVAVMTVVTGVSSSPVYRGTGVSFA